MKDIEDVNETYAGELKYLHSIAISLKRIADVMTSHKQALFSDDELKDFRIGDFKP